jgi:predicted metalloprotease
MPYTSAAGRRLGEGGTTQHRRPGLAARRAMLAVASAAVVVVALGIGLAIRAAHTAPLGDLGSLDGRSLGWSARGGPSPVGCAAETEGRSDCRILAVLDRAQHYWSGELPRYRPARTTFFVEAAATPCGPARGDVVSLYCPRGNGIYVDLGFFAALEVHLPVNESALAQAYVLAHELGHHVQALTGRLPRGDSGRAGPAVIRIELQADCYAGVWMRHELDSGRLGDVGRADAMAALDGAARVSATRIDGATAPAPPDAATHGHWRQRQGSFERGLVAGRAAACVTPAGV